MKIPPGKTEAEVLEAIEKAVVLLAPKFVFAGYQVDDIAQQGRLEAILALERSGYDPSRPLGNWLYRAIHHGLANFKRNNYRRNDPPCKRCHQGNHCCDPGPCQPYRDWWARQAAKVNIRRPIPIDSVASEGERASENKTTPDSIIEQTELSELIDARLPTELRATYARMLAGVTVLTSSRRKVEAAVLAILAEAGLDVVEDFGVKVRQGLEPADLTASDQPVMTPAQAAALNRLWLGADDDDEEDDEG